jgi:plastocyanin
MPSLRAAQSVARRLDEARGLSSLHTGPRQHRRVARWGASACFLLCILCVACGVMAGTVAIAAPGHRSSDRRSHTARVCHRHRGTHHRRCPAARAGKKSHGKYKQGSSKPSSPKSASKGSGATAPWTTAPAPVIPGSTSGSGASPAPPGSPGETPSSGSPTVPAGPAHVQVIATEYHLALSQTEVPSGKVIVNFVNDGQDEHNLNTAESPSSPESSSVFEATKSGAHPELPITMHAGTYTLFCSLPGHRAKGMEATLVVK